jgi:hypothetical protein
MTLCTGHTSIQLLRVEDHIEKLAQETVLASV